MLSMSRVYAIQKIPVNAHRVDFCAKRAIMKTANDRLKWARQRAGYDAAAAAAESLGVAGPTYYGHENGGRSFQKLAELYARKFKVPVAWLMYGTGPRPGDAPELKNLDDDLVTIREIDVRAGAGGGGVVAMEYGFADDGSRIEAVRDEWKIPRNFIAGQVGARNARVDIIEVLGDSMEPNLSSGDKVLVDLSHTNPWPDGIFVLWDGYGVIVKRVEIIRGREVATVRVKSDNPRHDDFELTLDVGRIIGRVVAKISTRI